MVVHDCHLAVILHDYGWRHHFVITMLGIIVGIVSVVTTVSLGEGIKQQVVGQINRLGDNVITVRPGRLVNRDSRGNITKVNINSSAALNSGSLPAGDLAIINKTKGVGAAAPVSLISGGAKFGNKEYAYEVKAFWDKKKKRPYQKSKYLGMVVDKKSKLFEHKTRKKPEKLI